MSTRSVCFSSQLASLLPRFVDARRDERRSGAQPRAVDWHPRVGARAGCLAALGREGGRRRLRESIKFARAA